MDGRTFTTDQGDKDRRDLSRLDGFPALGLSDKELKELIEDKAEVWLDGGAIFGESGSGFERINVACQRATLVEALDRIEKAVKEKVHG